MASCAAGGNWIPAHTDVYFPQRIRQLPSNHSAAGDRAYRLARELGAILAVENPDLALIFTPILNRLSPCRHGPGFASVVWNGARFSFTRAQAHAVQILWEAWDAGTPEVCQEILLEGEEDRRMVDLFKGHPAWGTMIVRGPAKGTFRLSDRQENSTTT